MSAHDGALWPMRVVRAAGLMALMALVVVRPTAVAQAQERRVVVVGDSVILGAQGPMTTAFTSQGWAVTFDAAVNRSTTAGLDAIESHRPELTDSLVVNLGANDAGNTAAYRQRVQAILDATATVPHVYWITIREVRDYYGPANQVVREVAAGRPNVTVIDWHAATAGATDLTAGDGLHLSPAGANRMAQVVADSVFLGAFAAAAPPVTAPVAAPTTVPPTTAPTTAPATSVAEATVPSTSPPSTVREERSTEPRDAAVASTTAADDRTDAAGDDDAFRLWPVALAALLGLVGAAVAGWWLLRRRSMPAPVPSSAHPAVRARQRAERIAEAAAAASAPPQVESAAGQSAAQPVGPAHTQQT